MQETLLRSQSRVRWLVEGDRNTTFLHNMVKIRCLHKPLASLWVGSVVLDDRVQIADTIVQYFCASFSQDPSTINTGLVERVIPALVTEEENIMLTTPPSDEEVASTVKSIDGFSASGPDGFGGCFFQFCWDVVM